MSRIDFAWELGGNSGHVATLLPLARALKARGHEVRLLARDINAGAGFEGISDLPRVPAPVWVGPVTEARPRNFGEILLNFGYADATSLAPLVEAWRERLAGAAALVASVAPAAHLAALTLGIPSLEISQGFHVPPPGVPAAPMHDWEPAERARLEAADRRVLGAMNAVLALRGTQRLSSLGELFAGRALLLTYPELDVYPQRGPADYFGVPNAGEGGALPAWPQGEGPRVLVYLYGYYGELEPLLAGIAATRFPALVYIRNADAALVQRHAGAPIHFSPAPLALSRVLPQCQLVVCHASHQTTAAALLAGKPLLLAPTQLEQFLIARRVIRFGAGLGMAPREPQADYAGALRELGANPAYGAKAREFAARYAAHDRGAALASLVERCEAAARSGPQR